MGYQKIYIFTQYNLNVEVRANMKLLNTVLKIYKDS